ncbi:MAG: hypothetical protein HC770_06590 [Pseudanabaena sp. CRU_2_10]|nr:hypothetical protein [Pseudanabaena sp. CRU_2_10]
MPNSVEHLDKKDKAHVSERDRKASPTKATKGIPGQKKALAQPAIVANTVSKPSAAASKSTVSKISASKAAVSSRDISVTSNKNQGKVENSQIPVSVRDAIVFDYLSYVFSDLEMFPSRGSINEFFKAYFTVDFNLNKKSREQVIGRLCRLLFQKKLNRAAIGDILLRATNSKYGAFLKEKDAVFIKGWQQ